MTTKTYPETRYWGKRISECGHQPVYKQLLPDGEPTELSPAPSQKLRNHSPDGFQWGYGGSGPAQLALALLLDVTSSPDVAQAHYQDFKFHLVASWGEEWSITSREILEWLARMGTLELEKKVLTNRN
ncbi:hypothetical protein ES703_05392 [subsurface metagenome]